MKRLLVVVIGLLMILTSCSQGKTKEDFISEEYNLEMDEGIIYGTLTIPKGEGPFPIAIIIQGSGPTDRNGNNPLSGVNNSLKMIAESLGNKGIASIRYDKRGIGESRDIGGNEEDLLFDDYINDVLSWIMKLKEDNRFHKYFIIGHSEGALIGGEAAARTDVDGFISIAGTGEPAYDALERQLKSQPNNIYDRSLPIIEELKKGNLVPNPPEDLGALFRSSVQPYLISWFKYNPKEVIGKINAPILILQGDNDLQVTVEDGKILEENSSGKLIIINGMNHVLKDVPADEQKNIYSYSDPKLPLHKELVRELVNFINENK